MNYAFLRDIVTGAWHIDPFTLNSLMPIYKGMISGVHIDQQPEPEENRPYLLAAAASSPNKIIQWTDDEIPVMEEEDRQEKVVNVLPIRGLITKHDQECGPRGMRTQAKRLMRADADENVIGHVIIAESGGGMASAVEEMTEAIEQATKPVVLWIDGMAASAMYYIGCYSQHVIASRDKDMVGCIGTMARLSGRKSKSEANLLGEVEVTVYADGSEEKNEEFDQAIDNFDFSLVKSNVLNPLNADFKDAVKKNRSAVTEDHLKGRTFFASDVVGTLIDEIGPFSLAVDKVLELAEYEPNQNHNNTNQKSNQNSIQMNKFELLTAVLVAAGFATAQEMELDADNQVTLSNEHLQAIESALAANNTEELTQQLNEATQNLETANATIAERDETITEQTTQIENLQKGAGASTTQVQTNGNVSDNDEDLSQEDVALFNQIRG